jgi:hypothetical protein
LSPLKDIPNLHPKHIVPYLIKRGVMELIKYLWYRVKFRGRRLKRMLFEKKYLSNFRKLEKRCELAVEKIKQRDALNS